MPASEPIPLHALPGVRAVRRRGRPPKIRVAPDADERAYHAEVDALRREALEHDPLVLATDARGDVLDEVIVALAREAAGLRWDRMRAQERGLETAAQVSSRVVDAYAKLAALVLERHELRRGEPSPAKLVAVQEMFVQSIQEVVIEVLGDKAGRTLMNRLHETLRADAAE